MPAVLTDSRLCDPHVPDSWAGVLDDLRAFVELEQALHADKQAAARSANVTQLLSLHDRLVERSAELLEPATLAEMPAAELDRLFARSVLILARLKQCVAAGREVLDTAGSRTLELYEADFYDTPENVETLIERLRGAVTLSRSQLNALAAEVDRDLGDARRKQLIVSALREEFQLVRDAADLRKNVHALFQAVYPESGLVDGEVDLVLTGTLIFFCLPLGADATELTTDRFHSLSEDRQRPIREFLQKVKRFTQERFAHFPAFGYVDRERVDRSLLERLSARTELSADEVLDELPQLITILPVTEIDKYLIHDVWGHGWQASMLRFDDLYSEMARFARPLDLGQSAQMADGSLITFSDCFLGSGDRLTLDENAFERFARALVAQRLPVALSAVLAEVMADVAEYKFLDVHPDKSDLLPSSSRLYVYPAMLDLTLRDVPFYFRQATKALRLWARRDNRQQRTCDQLVAAGAEEPAARKAVQDAVRVWNDLAGRLFWPELSYEPAGEGRLRVNVFTRVMLNFVGIHRAILQTYARLDETRPGGLPLKSYRDLLVIGASVFFEADPARNLWRVDEYLTGEFLPQCRRL